MDDAQQNDDDDDESKEETKFKANLWTQPYDAGAINTVTSEISDTITNEPDDGDHIAIDNSMFMDAAAPADTALWDLEHIGENIDAEAYEDQQIPYTEMPDPGPF